MEFLLTTLPEDTAANYKKKLAFSQKFWQEKGGALSDQVISKLAALGISFHYGPENNRRTDKRAICMEYLDDVDIEEFQEIPTYKRMCVCIMKNDHLCKYMGFTLNKTETQLRAEAETKYRNSGNV